jgi:hypothetical protein
MAELLVLARSFFQIQGLGLLSFINNDSFPLLAQSFLRAQGLDSAESGYVLLYIEHFGLSRKRRDREKESPRSDSYYMYFEYFNLGRKTPPEPPTVILIVTKWNRRTRLNTIAAGDILPQLYFPS